MAAVGRKCVGWWVLEEVCASFDAEEEVVKFKFSKLLCFYAPPHRRLDTKLDITSSIQELLKKN